MEHYIIRQRTIACSDERFEDYPDTLALLSLGEVHYTKGQTPSTLIFTRDDAERIINEFHSRARDLVIDYEHQSLTGQEAPAAGWIDRLTFENDTLYAHVKCWTAKAQDYLRQYEYRYVSPVLLFEDNMIVAIHSLGLTNHPALHGSPPLSASDTLSPEGQACIAQAFHDGKLLEHQRAWAEKLATQNLSLFNDFCKHAPRVAPHDLSTSPSSSTFSLPHAPKSTALSDFDPNYLSTLCGLSPETIDRLTQGD